MMWSSDTDMRFTEVVMFGDGPPNEAWLMPRWARAMWVYRGQTFMKSVSREQPPRQ